MAGLIFWDVDTQNDFMHADGKLYVPKAEEIIPRLEALNEYAHTHGIRIIASADDHVLEHEEISDDPDFDRTYPPHCMRGTSGQRKIPETALLDALVIDPVPQDSEILEKQIATHDGDILFHKHWFDVFTNPNVEPVLAVLDPDEIVLYGVALDVCNRYAIEGLLTRRPNTRLFLVTDATKPIDANRATDLVAGWARRGVRLVTAEEALRFGQRTQATEESTLR
jgi:nicotinamidase/pyrazinamidase